MHLCTCEMNLYAINNLSVALRLRGAIGARRAVSASRAIDEKEALANDIHGTRQCVW